MKKAYSTLFTAIIFVFAFQVITDFVASIYALNLVAFSLGDGEMLKLYLESPEEAEALIMGRVVGNTLTGLLLLAPVLLLFFRKRFPSGLSSLAAVGLIGCRIAESLLPAGARLYVAGIGTACFLVLFPTYVQSRTWRELRSGLAVSWLLLIFFRSAGSGIDVTQVFPWQVVTWILGAGAILLFWLGRKVDPVPEASVPIEGPGPGRSVLVALSLTIVLFFLYMIFVSPSVLARWTETDTRLITVLLAIVATTSVGISAYRPSIADGIPRAVLLAWNGLMVVMVFLTILLNMTPFPAAPEAYPLTAAATSWFHRIPLVLAVVLSPVLVVDFAVLVRGLTGASARRLALAFTVGGFGLLLLVFSVIFTIIWSYLPPISTLFKDNLHVVFLVAGLVMIIPLAFTRRSASGEGEHGVSVPVVVGALVVCVASIVGAFVTQMRPPEHPQEADSATDSITVMTYNVQAGYDVKGNWNFGGQLEVIRDDGADIIGLQESDACRIAGGNNDFVKYVADALDYYAYFGPKTVTGTFGVALLSRFPIENPQTHYVGSEGEQIAAVEGRITVGGVPYTVIVTHLGNLGPMQEQQDVLEIAEGKQNVILMGDFNFNAESPQYALTTSFLDDTLAMVPQEYPGTIDHVFVSPGIKALEYVRSGGTNSDHPAVTVRLSR